MIITIDIGMAIVTIVASVMFGKYFERSRWCRIAARTFGRLSIASKLQGGINEALGRKGRWSIMVGQDDVIAIMAAAVEVDRSIKARLNCDVYRERDRAHEVWFDWTGTAAGQNEDGTVKLTFGEWLLAKYDRG